MPNGYINGQPDVGWWMTQVNAGIAYRKKYAKQDRWDIWRSYYRGNWAPGILPTAVFFKMLRTTVPRVYFRNPSISLQPAKPGMVNWVFAQLLERIDNKLLKKTRLKKQAKSVVQDAFLFGTGILKLGFGAEFTPTPNSVGIGTAGPILRNGQRVEYNSLVIPNMPWMLRTRTGNFIVPAGCENLQSARWVGEWIRRSVDDVRDDARFKHVKNLTGSSRVVVSKHMQTLVPDLMQTQDLIDMVEIRDKKTGMVFVLAPFASDRVLLFEDDEMQATGRTPFYDCIFNEDDEVFWGVPDSTILEPQQLEANDIRTQMMRHRRLALVKILAKKKSMSETEMNKLVDGSISPVIQVDGDPINDIRMIEASHVPDDLYKMDIVNMQDVRETFGFGRNEFGETNPANARVSAEEVRNVREASSIRVDERRDIVADMITEVIEDMHSVIFSQWTDEQVIDVIGPGGIPIWVQFRPDMLRSGAYEVKVDPDSSLPETKELRSNRALVLYERLKTNPFIDPMRLTLYLLHELHGVQFDDMIRGVPPGAGTAQRPLTIEQFMMLQQAVAQRAPQALIAAGGQAAGISEGGE